MVDIGCPYYGRNNVSFEDIQRCFDCQEECKVKGDNMNSEEDNKREIEQRRDERIEMAEQSYVVKAFESLTKCAKLHLIESYDTEMDEKFKNMNLEESIKLLEDNISGWKKLGYDRIRTDEAMMFLADIIEALGVLYQKLDEIPFVEAIANNEAKNKNNEYE